MAIEIVDFPMKNGGSFHSNVKLPEGISFAVLYPSFRRCFGVFPRAGWWRSSRTRLWGLCHAGLARRDGGVDG